LLSRLFSRASNPEEKRLRAWCRSTLGITPGDLALYRQAMRHSSAVPDDRPDLPNNERLEFLGDAILDAIVGTFLFQKYPDQGEGFLTRMRSKLVSRHQLNILAKRVHIEKVIESNVSRGHETSVPGNALEALIGAIFLDKGFDRTRKLVLGLIDENFDLKEVEAEDRDAKSRLLEWGQKKRKRVEFNHREEHHRGRGKLYVCEVTVDGHIRGTGKGNSKKKAEQEAAQAALRGSHARGGHRGDHHREHDGERTTGEQRRTARGGHRRTASHAQKPGKPQHTAAHPAHDHGAPPTPKHGTEDPGA
jgi:ribonuclease-3